MKRKLEVCCYTAESAIIAEEAGADRIELCDNYSEGGTTPSFAVVKFCLEKLKIPVNVIVRPRGGDFLYSDSEYEIIKQDIIKLKEMSVNGIVTGFLNSDGEIDLEKTKETAELISPLEFTFHRAFDMCKDPFKVLEPLVNLGVNRVLTSGAKVDVDEGIDNLIKLVKLADNKISIMPGCGVTDKNLKTLIQRTDAVEYHSSAKTFVQSGMKFFNSDVTMGKKGSDEFKKISTDPDQIKRMINILKEN